MIDTYFTGLRERLVRDGCEVSEEELGSLAVTVGYKWQVKALSKMHIFTAAARRERIDGMAVHSLTKQAVDLAKERKGLWRGAQSGVLALSALVSEDVDPSAIEMMRKPYRLKLAGFAAMAQPVVVDLGRGEVHTFRGTRLIGYAYNKLIRAKCAEYFPVSVITKR